MAYISFVGSFDELPNLDELQTQYPERIDYWTELDYDYQDVECSAPTGFRNGLSYYSIGGQDSVTVYLAKIDDKIGHLVADCPAAGWVEECFCYLNEDGEPVKSGDDFNPNPIEQII